MNSYQIIFLKKIINSVISNEGNGDFKIDDEGNLIIIQNENYNITNYFLKIINNDFSNVSYFLNGWVDADIDSKEISIPVDFNNPILKISFKFNNGLVDDFEVCLKFEKADKNLWDDKFGKIIMEQRLENINVELEQEGTLHTVIFMPCCDEYSYSEIRWYAVSSISHKIKSGGIGGHDIYSSPKVIDKIFLEKVEVKDKFYCNIECAFNVGVEVTQYDKNENVLISTSKGFKK